MPDRALTEHEMRILELTLQAAPIPRAELPYPDAVAALLADGLLREMSTTLIVLSASGFHAIREIRRDAPAVNTMETVDG